MMKKILGLVLAGAMVLSMAACGNDGASGSASGDGSQAAVSYTHLTLPTIA